MKTIIMVKGKKVVVEGTPDSRGFITKNIGKDCTLVAHPKKGAFAMPRFK